MPRCRQISLPCWYVKILRLVWLLPLLCLTELALLDQLQGSKDGKTAWKMRKEAMDEIEVALKRCTGLIETTSPQMKQLAELMRGLRDRLTDTQINLRPTAARLIGSLLSAVDKVSQSKLGKIVLSPLINEAMNDIKKPMRDASLAAIRSAFTASWLDGGGINEQAFEALINSLVAEVNEAAIRVSSKTNSTSSSCFLLCPAHLRMDVSRHVGRRITRCIAVAAFSR